MKRRPDGRIAARSASQTIFLQPSLSRVDWKAWWLFNPTYSFILFVNAVFCLHWPRRPSCFPWIMVFVIFIFFRGSRVQNKSILFLLPDQKISTVNLVEIYLFFCPSMIHLKVYDSTTFLQPVSFTFSLLARFILQHHIML